MMALHLIPLCSLHFGDRVRNLCPELVDKVVEVLESVYLQIGLRLIEQRENAAYMKKRQGISRIVANSKRKAIVIAIGKGRLRTC